jgi:hypothetical protein
MRPDTLNVRAVLRGIVYVLFLVISVIAGVEILLRLFFGNPTQFDAHRYLFASEGAFRVIGPKLWTYAPSRELRLLAVYQFPGARLIPAAAPRIEFDCLYRTNNLGLVEGRNFRAGDKAVVVFGDSYTEGQGGCPWFYRLEERFPDAPLLNGGLQGLGPLSWQLMAEHLAETGIEIERIVVVAISNDFKRDPWAWPDGALDCMSHWHCRPDEYWQPLRPNEDAASVLSRADARAEARYKGQTKWWKLHQLLQLSSYGYAIGSAMLGAGAKAEIQPQKIEAIKALQKYDKSVHVILVSMRDEAVFGRKNPDSLLAEKMLAQASIPYRWCTLTRRDFLPLDAHPTAKGYVRLAECVEADLHGMGY